VILILDNYDSFTYNIYQLFSELGAEVEVIRHDCITVEEIRQRGYEALVISPGPGVPKEAGISEEAIRQLGPELPILGICLGHQAIGEVYGGKVVRAGAIVHGKSSALHHDGRGLYEGLPQNIPVARYHSLIVERESLPDCLEISSELEDGTIMGLRHKEYPVEGIQFHPESILTPEGHKMLANFLKSLEKV
jgi:anthranilate synthase/aminodeoxychorismate synthase-like glutamine amidotransferase